MDLKQIEFFLQLYKDRNITKASQNLFISQQGLSKSIANLEDELGFHLFERDFKGVFPNTNGEELYPYFESVSNAFQLLNTKAAELGERNFDKLRIGYYPGFPFILSDEFFIQFQKKHPEVVSNYYEDSSEAIEQMLLANFLDVGFLLEPFSSELVSHMLFNAENIYAIMKKDHSLAKRESISLKDLHQQKVIFVDGLPRLNNWTKQKLQDEHSEPDIIKQKIYIMTLLPMISAYQCIGLCSKKVFQCFDVSAEFAYIPLKESLDGTLKLRVHLVTSNRKKLKKDTISFISYVKKTSR